MVQKSCQEVNLIIRGPMCLFVYVPLGQYLFACGSKVANFSVAHFFALRAKK